MNKYDLQKLIKSQLVIKCPGIRRATFRALAKSFMNHIACAPTEKDGSRYDSYSNICIAIECSRPTLQKIIAYWHEEGIMTWKKGWRNKNGDGEASVYHFDEAAMRARLTTQQEWLNAEKAKRPPRPATATLKSSGGMSTLGVYMPTPAETGDPSVEHLDSKVAGKPIAFTCQPAQPIEDTQVSQNGSKNGTSTHSIDMPPELACKPIALSAYTYGSISKNTINTENTLSVTPDESFSECQERSPQVEPTPTIQMPTSVFEATPARPFLRKPCTTLEWAQKTLKAFEARGYDLAQIIVCVDCGSVGQVKDGHCTFTDGGTALPCDSTRLVSGLEWIDHISTQWEAYNAQERSQKQAASRAIMESLGVTRAAIAGRLDIPSMEKQPDIVKCRKKAETKSIAERRTFAKECYDSGKRNPMRKAWFLYAVGMLDDEDEPEPWVKQLFADLETTLKPRPKAQTFTVPVAEQQEVQETV